MQYLLSSLIGNALAILIGITYFKRLSVAYKIILLQVLLVAICEVLGYIASFNPEGNARVFNLFYFIPELCLSGLAGMMLAQNTTIKKVSPFLIFLGTIIWAINIYSNGLNVFSNWTLLYIGVALTIIYFDILIYTSFSKKVLAQPNFWLSLSYILYFCCAIPYFGMYNYIATKSLALLNNLFYINQALNFIRYPLIALSFYLYGRQHKQKLQGNVLAD